MNGVAVAEAVARPEINASPYAEGSVASVLWQDWVRLAMAVVENSDSKPITLDGTNPQIGNYQLTIARLPEVYLRETWQTSLQDSYGRMINSAHGPSPMESFDNLLKQLSKEPCGCLNTLLFANGRKAVSA